MNKTVKKVFMLLGLLVAIFLFWQLVFNDGGILQSVYNGVAEGINGQYAKVAGDNKKILPVWGKDNKTDTNGKGFDIGTTPNGN